MLPYRRLSRIRLFGGGRLLPAILSQASRGHVPESRGGVRRCALFRGSISRRGHEAASADRVGQAMFLRAAILSQPSVKAGEEIGGKIPGKGLEKDEHA